MSATYANAPEFDGQAIFGYLPSFTWQFVLPGTVGELVAIDEFLGRTIGTTTAVTQGARVFGLTGLLVAPTSAGVQALEATLLSFAGLACSLGLPTFDRWPSNYQWWPACEFIAADFVPSAGGIVAFQGNQFALPYSLVVRQIPGY